MMSSVVCLLLLLPCLLSATPFKRNEGESIFLRVARDTQLIRSERQSDSFRCENEGQNDECLPSGITNVSTSLVRCVAGQCVCEMCFTRNSSGQCQICSDYPFSNTLGECGVDDRPRQLTAFLLSLFLSSTGAANFYIGQTNLAGGQLFLLILTFAMAYLMCCLPCCLACCLSKDEVKGSAFFIIFMVLAILVVVCAAISMWAWWIADLVIFATNQRLSGNGCELTPNL